MEREFSGFVRGIEVEKERVYLSIVSQIAKKVNRGKWFCSTLAAK